jgi:predicted Rossmann fold nucleotide-binding protein DprA/Smf involved in DNA uptake
MKEYRLATWPELRAPFDRMAHRRMLTDMSHRHMTLEQLVDCSGSRRNEVRAFLAMLELRGLVTLREAESVRSMFGPLRLLAGWLLRVLGSKHIGR